MHKFSRIYSVEMSNHSVHLSKIMNGRGRKMDNKKDNAFFSLSTALEVNQSSCYENNIKIGKSKCYLPISFDLHFLYR